MNFQYTRKRGEKRTYDVTVRMIRSHGGPFDYQASIYHGDDFKGQRTGSPLTALDLDSAMMEAREFIEQDIEDLVGVME